MEENLEENVKNDNKKVKILIGLIILIMSIVILVVVNRTNNCSSIYVKHKIFKYSLNEEEETILGTNNSNDSGFEIISDYKEYKDFQEEFNEYIKNNGNSEDLNEFEKELFKEKYNEKFLENYNIVLVEKTIYNRMFKTLKLRDVFPRSTDLVVSIEYDTHGIVGGKYNALFFMTIRKDRMNGVFNVDVNTNEDNDSNINNYPETFDKPIIYLYPKNNTNVSVKLSNPENLICSYPLYKDNGWQVNAEPDGMLTYLENGRKLYSLYYESENIVDFNIEEDGFVVKGEDSVNFLEEKLEILGLNEIETEEFIIYWLPKLEVNKYNYIRFATLEEINNNMELEIQPKPDSVIRVLMVFKGLDEPIEVKEQELVSPNRDGFAAVEWGGTEIK